jgi:hypothetical protein
MKPATFLPVAQIDAKRSVKKKFLDTLEQSALTMAASFRAAEGKRPRRTTLLGPGSSSAWGWSAAMRNIETAMLLQPHPSSFYYYALGLCYFTLSEYEIAIESLSPRHRDQPIIHAEPLHPGNYIWTVHCVRAATSCSLVFAGSAGRLIDVDFEM